MPAFRPRPRRRVPLIPVLAALLAAVLTAGWSGAQLVREPRTVDEVALEQATTTVVPGPGVPVDRAEGLHVYLVPHPDDELSAWTALADQDHLHPVVVLLTRGEATARCATSGTECGQARLGSFREVLSEAAEHTPLVAGLSDDSSVLELDLGPWRAGLVTSGRASLITMDLGDGELEAAEVAAAVEAVLARRGQDLPDLPLGRITASAYLARPAGPPARPPCTLRVLCPAGDRAYVYDRPDHVAVQDAARSLAARAEQGAWLVTHPYDPSADVHRALPEEVYASFMGLGEGDPAVARRLGSYQRWYGWLAFPDVWRPGDLPLDSAQVIFPRVQSFTVVGG